MVNNQKRYKRILFLFLLVVFFLISVNSAYAADKSTTSSSSLSLPDPTIQGKPGNYLTIQDAVDAASAGDTIILDPGTYTGTGNQAININKDLTIKGPELIGNNPPTAVIDAGGKNRIFNIDLGVKVTIKNVDLKNGYTTESGAAILNKGDLTLTDSVIDNNKATDNGAIFNYGGSVNIVNCDFTNNTSNFFGGAIYNTGTASISNSTFTSNKAYTGGAICNEYTLNIESCEFKNNSATIGGAIENTGNLIIKNSSLVNNNVTEDGGAIKNDFTGILYLQNTVIKSNKANSGGGIYNDGTVALDDPKNISNNSPDNTAGNPVKTLIINQNTNKLYYNLQTAINEASKNDTIRLYFGTIYENLTINKDLKILGSGKISTIINGQSLGSCIIISSGVTCTLSMFSIRNGVSPRGAGIKNQGNLTINNCEISNNTAYDKNYMYVYGGGIYNQGVLTITNSVLHNNTVSKGQDYAGGYGGAIYNSGTLNMEKTTLDSNFARVTGNSTYLSCGGGISNDENGIVILKTCTFTDNSAGYSLVNDRGYGGAIFNRGKLDITGCNFEGNSADPSSEGNGPSHLFGGKGGAIFNDMKGVVNITNTTFKGNHSLNGGAFYTVADSTNSIKNCTFEDNYVNTLNENGHEISSVEVDGMELVTAIFNTCDGILRFIMEPAYFFETINKTIEGVNGIIGSISYTEEKMLAIGGAISMGGKSNLAIENCTFKNNSGASGGAVSNFGTGSLNVENSDFEGNNAGLGAAIYCSGSGPLNVSWSNFIKNIAGCGGAICYTGTDADTSKWGTCIVTYNIFTGNSAGLGDVLYNSYGGNTHSYISYNLIYGNENLSLYGGNKKMNATLNWWGSNKGPGIYETSDCNVFTDPYIMLTVTANPKEPSVPKELQYGQTTVIIADFLHDSSYNINNPDTSKISPDFVKLLNGMQITFNIENGGTITPIKATIVNGVATATYKAEGNIDTRELVQVFASAENIPNDTVSTLIKVTKVPTRTTMVINENTITIKVTEEDNFLNLINDGYVELIVGNETPVKLKLVNGYAVYQRTIPEGQYDIIATYLGTSKYSTSSETLIHNPANGADNGDNSSDNNQDNSNSNQADKNSGNSTIPLKDTGVPLLPLALALTMVSIGTLRRFKR